MIRGTWLPTLPLRPPLQLEACAQVRLLSPTMSGSGDDRGGRNLTVGSGACATPAGLGVGGSEEWQEGDPRSPLAPAQVEPHLLLPSGCPSFSGLPGP